MEDFPSSEDAWRAPTYEDDKKHHQAWEDRKDKLLAEIHRLEDRAKTLEQDYDYMGKRSEEAEEALKVEKASRAAALREIVQMKSEVATSAANLEYAERGFEDLEKETEELRQKVDALETKARIDGDSLAYHQNLAQKYMNLHSESVAKATANTDKKKLEDCTAELNALKLENQALKTFAEEKNSFLGLKERYDALLELADKENHEIETNFDSDPNAYRAPEPEPIPNLGDELEDVKGNDRLNHIQGIVDTANDDSDDSDLDSDDETGPAPRQTIVQAPPIISYVDRDVPGPERIREVAVEVPAVAPAPIRVVEQVPVPGPVRYRHNWFVPEMNLVILGYHYGQRALARVGLINYDSPYEPEQGDADYVVVSQPGQQQPSVNLPAAQNAPAHPHGPQGPPAAQAVMMMATRPDTSPNSLTDSDDGILRPSGGISMRDAPLLPRGLIDPFVDRPPNPMEQYNARFDEIKAGFRDDLPGFLKRSREKREREQRAALVEAIDAASVTPEQAFGSPFRPIGPRPYFPEVTAADIQGIHDLDSDEDDNESFGLQDGSPTRGGRLPRQTGPNVATNTPTVAGAVDPSVTPEDQILPSMTTPDAQTELVERSLRALGPITPGPSNNNNNTTTFTETNYSPEQQAWLDRQRPATEALIFGRPAGSITPSPAPRDPNRPGRAPRDPNASGFRFPRLTRGAGTAHFGFQRPTPPPPGSDPVMVLADPANPPRPRKLTLPSWWQTLLWFAVHLLVYYLIWVTWRERQRWFRVNELKYTNPLWGYIQRKDVSGRGDLFSGPGRLEDFARVVWTVLGLLGSDGPKGWIMPG